MVWTAVLLYQTIAFNMVTQPGIEPGIQPWEGCVLTTWPQGRPVIKALQEGSCKLE